jgi:hypothetical protein
MTSGIYIGEAREIDSGKIEPVNLKSPSRYMYLLALLYQY